MLMNKKLKLVNFYQKLVNFNQKLISSFNQTPISPSESESVFNQCPILTSESVSSSMMPFGMPNQNRPSILRALFCKLSYSINLIAVQF